MDLSKPSELGMAAGEAGAHLGHHQGLPAGHKLTPSLSAMGGLAGAMQGSGGMDMAGILQAGLIHPVTGQIVTGVNGSLRRDDSMLRRRRGRRRNVETTDMGFKSPGGEVQSRVEVISHSVVSSSTSSPSLQERLPGPSTPTPTPTLSPSPSSSQPQLHPQPQPQPQSQPQPEIVAIDREAASKGLLEWLRQNPNYSMELPAFSHSGAGVLHGFMERPKQRRHRCKDPTKLDVNTLTGEERVPVVHRSTGRRLGGAMAPAIKELSRWLDANSEYCVAPDWAEVVKHSGFLPEGKFTRILTEPVNRDPGSRRRGRRPRSEMPKPLLSEAPPGMAPPLFMNGGVIGSMDGLVGLQNLRGVPSLPLAGLMAGFPHGFAIPSGEDAKNGLSMLPMMLHSIPHGAVPQHMFSMGSMMSQAQPPSSSAASSSSSSSAAVVTTTAAGSPSSTASSPTPRGSSGPMGAEGSSSAEGGERRREERQGEGRSGCGMMGSHSVASITTSAPTSGNVTFNPFMLPGMSHSLLYPHMFLSPGGLMTLPGLPHHDPASPRRRRKRALPQTDEAPTLVVPGDEAEEAGPEAKGRGETPAPDSHDPPGPEVEGRGEEEKGVEDRGMEGSKMEEEDRREEETKQEKQEGGEEQERRVAEERKETEERQAGEEKEWMGVSQ